MMELLLKRAFTIKIGNCPTHMTCRAVDESIG